MIVEICACITPIIHISYIPYYRPPSKEKNSDMHELHKWALIARGSSCSKYSNVATPLIWNSARGRFLLPLPPPEHGTGCQQNSSWCVPRQFSSVPLKRSYSWLLIPDRIIKMESVIWHRSSCRRCTKSTVDYDYRSLWLWLWSWQVSKLALKPSSNFCRQIVSRNFSTSTPYSRRAVAIRRKKIQASEKRMSFACRRPIQTRRASVYSYIVIVISVRNATVDGAARGWRRRSYSWSPPGSRSSETAHCRPTSSRTPSRTTASVRTTNWTWQKVLQEIYLQIK